MYVHVERDRDDAGGVLQSGTFIHEVLRDAGAATVSPQPGVGGCV